MSACFMESPAISFRWEPQWPFAIFLAYEDRLTRARALWLFDHLRAKPLAHYNLRCACWRFNQLRQTDQSRHATDEALGADMIILSLHGQPEISPAVQRWIEGWGDAKEGQDCALVALIDRPDPLSSVRSPAVT